MNAKTFNIPIDNEGMAIERLKKLERTADRLGIQFPTVTFGEPFFTKTRDITGELLTHWWKPITLEGEGIDRPVSYGGWKIIGQFNHEYPQVILNRLSDEINTDFVRRFEVENVSWCQHCSLLIKRKNTYVIENEETHTQMLIGSTCMHHYVPHQKSLDSIMSYYMGFQELFEVNDDPDGLYRVHNERFTDTRSYLRECFQVMLAGVDIKSELFGEVLGYVRSHQKPKSGSEAECFVTKAHGYREDAESEMYHMMLFISALSESNEFNVRLKRMCEPGYHLIKDSNTVRWGAKKYYDYIHQPRAVRKGAENKWVGEEGQMLEVQVTFDKRVFLFSNEYGDSYLFTFKTAEGNTITWKTSYMDTEFLQGDMVIRGRVKELTEYNGVKQTQVTRAKLRKL